MKKDAVVGGDYPYGRESGPARLAKRLLFPLIRLIFPPIFRRKWHYRVRGAEAARAVEGPLVTVCNHVRFLDCLMVGLALQPREVRIVSIKGNFQMPVLGPLIGVLGAWPLPDNLAGWRNFHRSAADLLRRGGVLHFYPEGSRQTDCRTLRPFRKGAFALAAETGAAVQPCVLRHYRRVSRSGRRKADGLELVFLQPLRPDESLPRGRRAEKLMRESYARMSHALHRQDGPGEMGLSNPGSGA